MPFFIESLITEVSVANQETFTRLCRALVPSHKKALSFGQDLDNKIEFYPKVRNVLKFRILKLYWNKDALKKKNGWF